MASEKQVNANRQNAVRSTGPRTPEGKRAVSQNAKKHGVLSQQALLPDEDPSELAELRQRLLDYFEPEGHLERLLVDRIVQLAWRLRRLGRTEVGLFTWARQQGGLLRYRDSRSDPDAA